MKDQDPCCFMCATPSGVCASRYRCQHHVDARREKDLADRGSTIGYRDPTGAQAVNNVMRERHRK